MGTSSAAAPATTSCSSNPAPSEGDNEIWMSTSRMTRRRSAPKRVPGCKRTRSCGKVGADPEHFHLLGRPEPEAEDAHVQGCKEWQRTLFDAGWAGITWPKECGRPRRPRLAAADLQRGAVALRRRGRRVRGRHRDGRARRSSLRHRGTAEALPARDAAGRRRSGASSSPSPAPAPTSPGFAPAPSATATSGW